MSEIGALVVKLTAETAAFREDLGRVKSDLNDLKGSAEQAGDGIDFSMTKARGGLMLVEDVAGVRLPRALNTLLAGIPGVGAAFQMMLPIAGVLVAIELVYKLVEAHEKAKEAAEALKGSQASLAGTIGSTMRGLEDKFLQAGKAADELNGNHLAAVKKELQLIDNQSMAELASTFDALAKSADASFALLKAHWYEVGSGSEGAKHSLAEFQAQYELLLNTGKKDDANKLLDAKLTRERQVLALQKEAAEQEKKTGSGVITNIEAVNRYEAAHNELKKMGIGYTEKEITSEQDLVDILQAHVNARQKIAATAAIEKHTATQKGENQTLAEQAAVQKILASATEEHAKAVAKLAQTQAEQAAAASKGGDSSIDDRLAAEKKQIEETKKAALEGAKEELAGKVAAYNAAYKAANGLRSKERELNAQWVKDARASSDSVIQINAEAAKQIAVADASANAERRKLAEELSKSLTSIAEATAKMVQSQTLDGIKVEEAANDAAKARGLETERKFIEEKIRLAKEEQKAKTEALNAEIAAQQKAADTAGGLNDAVAQNNAIAKRIQLQAQLNSLTTQYGTEIKTLTGDLTKLNSSWADYFSKMKTETMDLSTQIRTTLQSSVTKFTDSFAQGMAKCVVENKSLGAAVRQESGQMLEAVISMLTKQLEQYIITDAMKLAHHLGINATQKSADTAMAASSAAAATVADKTAQLAAASLAGANAMAMVAATPAFMSAPAVGATMFAAALSFETGGKIPGSSVGSAGAVPIIGHQGETVVTKALTDRVEASEGMRNGSMAGANIHFAPQIHAVDATGVDAMLSKHASIFQRHITSAMRRMNK